MSKKRTRAQVTDARNTVLVSRDEWEQLLASVRGLVDVHTQLLKRLKDIDVTRPEAEQLHKRPRSRKLKIAHTIGPKTDQSLPHTDEGESRPYLWSICLNCGREMLQNDKYCDRCGAQLSSDRTE